MKLPILTSKIIWKQSGLIPESIISWFVNYTERSCAIPFVGSFMEELTGFY